MKMKFIVNENVLIPRQDTEILVEEVIKLCKNIKNPKILDLCTGSGAIAISLAKNICGSKVTGGDISKEAIEVAKKNNQNLNTNVEFNQSDLFKNINGKFYVIVSNPPYIKSEVIKSLNKDVQNEPILALDGGIDGLTIYRRIINEAYKFLEEDGYLCFEIGFDQREAVANLIEKTKKYKDVNCIKDLAGLNRVIICKKNKFH